MSAPSRGTGPDGDPGFGLYLHWPYCSRICPYCDFNVYRDRNVDPTPWRAAFADDLAWWAGRLDRARLFDSVYFGGGTPSLMTPDLVGGVLAAANRDFGIAPGGEVTLEANPTDAERARFASFASSGVNRLSLGVQSLEDEALAFLGRNHTASETIKALEAARAVFDRLTFDLIYARPGQGLAGWQAELTEALRLKSGHLSLYQLTIEPGTAFANAVSRGDWAPPDEDLAADMYDIAQAMCADAGLAPYEVSNNAAPGHEAQHNLIYWRQGDYVGIGPGAHGRVDIDGTRHEVIAEPDPKRYLSLEPHERFSMTPLTPRDRAVEFLSMGLRLTEGISLSRYGAIAGAPLPARAIADLSGDDLVEVDGDRLSLTPAGRRVLNAVVLALAP